MEGFDPLRMPYLPNPMTLDGVTGGDFLNPLPVGMQEPVGLYDTGDFGGG